MDPKKSGKGTVVSLPTRVIPVFAPTEKIEILKDYSMRNDQALEELLDEYLKGRDEKVVDKIEKGK